MPIENKGPGGVGNSYGARAVSQPSLIAGAGRLKPFYDGFDLDGEASLFSNSPRIRAMLKSCSDATGIVAANSGTAATVSIDAASPFGRPAYKVAMPAGNAWHEVTLTGLSFPAFDGHVMWRVWINDHTTIQQIQTFAGTASYTRFWQGTYRLNNSNENRWNGEHVLRAGPTFAANTNTFLTGVDTLSDCKIRIFPGAAGADIWVDAIFIPAVGRATHCLTYDDCSVTWLNNVLPVLAAQNIRGTFGVNTGDIGGNPNLFLSASQLQQIANAGHQISPHNVSNTPMNDGTTGTQTASQYTADFVAASNTLAGIVGSALDISYTPWVQGRNNQAGHDAMRSVGLRIARGTDSADGYNFPHVGLGNGVMSMKNQSVHTFTTTAAMDAVFDIVNRYGLTVVWMTHEVLSVGGSDGGVDVETNVAMHRYLVERIARERNAGLCSVRTMGDLGRDLYRNRLVGSRLLP